MAKIKVYTHGGESVEIDGPESVLTKKQVKRLEKRIQYDGRQHILKVSIRYDDNCGNGHNSFAITGEVWRPGNTYDCETCGCIHDIIGKAFPELVPFLKWHLTSSDGPMHYVANTMYHARKCSHPGKNPGDPVAYKHDIFFYDWPIPWERSARKGTIDFINWVNAQTIETLELEAVPHKDRDGYEFGPHYTFKGYTDVEWHECPFSSLDEAEDFLTALKVSKPYIMDRPSAFATAVEPNIDAARNAAAWPDATLEQLQDEAALLKRLPALIEGFKTDMESLGFTY